MPRRVLLASTAEDEMLDVKLLLDASGLEVERSPSFDAILKLMRTEPPDLIVVSETLEGGSGTELCALLDGVPHRPLILYLGASPVRGADAAVAPGASEAIAETVQDLLNRGNGASAPAEPTEPVFDDETLGWAVSKRSTPPGRSDSPSGASPAANGRELLRAVVSEGLDSLLRRVREADYFEILGVAVDATPQQIRAAHQARLEALREIARVESAGRAHVEEVRTALDEALDVLVNPRLRESYTKNRAL